MFKDFDNTKKQLAELAEIVNRFKSEAVQLRLLELLFDATPHAIAPPESNEAQPKKKARTRRAKQAKSAGEPNGQSKSARKPSSLGPGTILNRLYADGFFKEAKTIADICRHADTSLARKIKPNEISGKLARMVRNGELSREKNSENQYEYTQP